MINLLMRFYDTNAGTIEVDGHNIRNVTRKSLRENVFGSLILNIQEKDKESVFKFLESKNVTWEVL